MLAGMTNWFSKLCGLMAASFFATGVQAQSVFPDLDEIVQGRILSGWQTESGTRMAAVEIELADGWKTYWRAPGDAGIPPYFTWNGSRNLRGVELHWPSPTVFLTSGSRTIGYTKTLLLPIEVKAKDPGKDVLLKGRMQLGVCEEICIPAEINFDLTLSGAGSSDKRIHAALAARPVPGSRVGVGTVVCSVDPIADGLRVTTRVEMPKLGSTETAILEAGDPTVWVSEPEVSRKGKHLIASADFVPPSANGFALNRQNVRITVLTDRMAIDIRGCTAG